jgi:hypothetical protein
VELDDETFFFFFFFFFDKEAAGVGAAAMGSHAMQVVRSVRRVESS